METSTSTLSARTTQTVCPEAFDLVVCGGGLAGVCAALAASRLKLRTALIQDRPVLGGNSSSEIRVPLAGAANGNPWARESGIIEELLLTERYNNFTSRRESMINDVWDLVLYDACRREVTLSLFLNTSIRGVNKAGGRVVSVLASQLASERELEIRGELFVDATGDGAVAYLAGAAWRMGREAKDEFDEAWAPEVADQGIMGSSLLFAVRDVGKPVPFHPPPWAESYAADSPILKTRFHQRLPGYWWIEVGFPFHTIADNEKIRDELLRHVLGVWDHLKNKENHGFSHYALDWIGKIPGKRESRRIMGDYLLTGNDLMQGRLFPDGVAHGGWYFDLHTPGGILAKEEAPEPTYGDASLMDVRQVPVYSIPLRCLYAKDLDNLFLAGRDISATHTALGSARLMATCATMGQAVGTCAWICQTHKILPREVFPQKIELLKQQLLKDDHYVPAARNEDRADLARTARATATSTSPLLFPEPTTPRRLDVPLGVLFPVSSDRVESVAFMVEAEQPARITVHLRRSRRTCDFNDENDVACISVEVPAGDKTWVSCKLAAKIKPQSLYWLAWDADPHVLLYGSEKMAPTGSVPVHKPFRKWHYFKPSLSWEKLNAIDQRWHPSIRIEPEQQPYGAENILSGVTRPDDWTHLWISHPALTLPQTATLEFEDPVAFNAVYLTFDTNLGLFANLHMPTWRAPDETVREYRLLCKRDGRWQELGWYRDNFLRRRIHRFERMIAEKIRIEILSTWGDPSARLYEIRVYEE